MLGDGIDDGLARRVALDLDGAVGHGRLGDDLAADGVSTRTCVALVVREPLEPRLLDGGDDDVKLVRGVDVVGEGLASDLLRWRRRRRLPRFGVTPERSGRNRRPGATRRG